MSCERIFFTCLAIHESASRKSDITSQVQSSRYAETLLDDPLDPQRTQDYFSTATMNAADIISNVDRTL